MGRALRRWGAYWWIITHPRRWREFVRRMEALTAATKDLEASLGRLVGADARSRAFESGRAPPGLVRDLVWAFCLPIEIVMLPLFVMYFAMNGSFVSFVGALLYGRRAMQGWPVGMVGWDLVLLVPFALSAVPSLGVFV